MTQSDLLDGKGSCPDIRGDEVSVEGDGVMKGCHN